MTRDLISKILIFAAGAGIGSAATYKVLKTKYDQLIREEIDSVKEAFSRNHSVDEMTGEEEKTNTEDENDHDLEAVKNIIVRNDYNTASNGSDEDEDEGEDREMNKKKGPYVISPTELGECDYPAMLLQYYEEDGIVTDDFGDIIENTDELIGDDFAAHFGDYEEDPDTVYVRNDEDEIDYEILKNHGSYPEY